MSNWHGGKGSKQRPFDRQKFSDNWDAIFKKTPDNVQENKPNQEKDDNEKK
jgi:hypothetical protein